MDDVLSFLIEHGYQVVFLVVLAEQIGLPVPSVVVLMAAGALAGEGRLRLEPLLGLSFAATLAGDLFWYELGRRKGLPVLSLLCRISLEPDSCVRKTENVFARHGAATLLIAKFVPGLNTAAPPLSGMFRMRLRKFLLFDGLGAVFWVATFLLAGFLFSRQLEKAVVWLERFGTGLGLFVVLGLCGWIGWKWYVRTVTIRRLRVARIEPQALKEKIDAGHPLFIVDLRHHLDFQANPLILPGALHLTPEELQQRHLEIPRDREIILYCS